MKRIIFLQFSLLAALLFNVAYVSAATYNMSTATITVANNDVYQDPGGTGNYANNLNITQVVNGCANMVFYFTTLSLGSGDTLWVYNGNSTSSPLLTMFTGTPPARPTIMSSGTVLCFRFKSDATANAAGWAATVKCVNINNPTASTAFGSPCHNGRGGMDAFCSDMNTSITFPNSSSANRNNDANTYLGQGIGWNSILTGNNYRHSCLRATPNPAWYYMRTSTPGDLLIYIEQRNNGGTLIDVDFICWGPFFCPSEAAFKAGICANAFTLSNCAHYTTILFINTHDGCDSHRPTGGNHTSGTNPLGDYPAGNVIDCSYDLAETEWCFIPNAQPNAYYLLMMTNYDMSSGYITFGREASSTATTDCSLLADIMSNSPLCEGDTLRLTTLNPEANTTYNWWGPGGWSSTAQDPIRPNVTAAMAGTYYMAKTSTITGRTSDTVSLEVSIGRRVYNDITVYCCTGANYIYRGNGFSIPVPTPGIYRDSMTFRTSLGCDSVVRLSLIGQSIIYNNITDSCCTGATYTRNGFSIPVPAPGLYRDTLNLTTAAGCDSVVTLLLIGQQPIYTYITDTCCTGAMYTRYGFSVSVMGAGHYQHTLNLSTELGCDSIVELHLIVGAAPSINAVVNNPCIADMASISLSFSGGLPPYQCIWDNGETTPSITELSTGTYTAVVTDSVNCRAEYSTTIAANYLQATAHTTDSYCQKANGGATVTASGGSGNYTFLPDGSTATPDNFTTNSDFTFTNLLAGTYRIRFTDGACTHSITFTVANLGAPKAVFFPEYNGYSIEIPVRFLNQSLNALSYSWDFGDGNSSTSASPIYLYDDYGKYTVTLIASDNYNCADTTSDVVHFIDMASCYFPNAFTPDGDDLNETFGPICRNIQTKDYLFVIYDRWGNKVFESQDINQQWDGTTNGKQAASAVYVWYLSYRDERNLLKEQRGAVTLVR